MDSPNPELMHLYGTDQHYLEKTGQLPPVAAALAKAVGFGLYLHDKKHVEQLLLEAELMNQRIRAAEAAKMRGVKAGFEGRLMSFRGQAPIEIDPSRDRLDRMAALVKGGSIQLDEGAEKIGALLGGRLAAEMHKQAHIVGDNETLALLEKMAGGGEFTELEKQAFMAPLLRAAGSLVGAGGRAATRTGNVLFKGIQTAPGRAVSRLGAKGQAAGEGLLLRGGATPTQAARAWTGPRSLPQIPKATSAPMPGLPKAPAAITRPAGSAAPDAVTRVTAGVAPSKAVTRGGPYRTQVPASSPATPAAYSAPTAKPAMVAPPQPLPPRPRTGALMEGGAAAGFTRAEAGAPQVMGAHRQAGPWQAEGEQLLAQRQAGQQALAQQTPAAAEAAEMATKATTPAASGAQTTGSKPWLSWGTKAKIGLGAGALGLGYAGYKGLQSARDYMMTPTHGNGQWGHYGPQLHQDVNPYGYV